MANRFITAIMTCLFAVMLATPLCAQSGPRAAPTVQVEVSQLPPAGVASFDPQKATEAYLARVSGKEKQRSDAYFEGGYVLQVVDVVYALVVAGFLMWLKISKKMRDFAAGITRFRFLQVPIYVVQYLVVATVLGLPLAVYEGFFREHAFGLSNQTFAQWAGEFGIAFVFQLIAFTVLLTLIYAAARAAKRRWWVWGWGLSVAFLILFAAVSPVFIAPAFNHYAPLPDSGLKSTILSMARSQGIPAKDVYTFDASKQSKRVSANVSGLFGTTRISLNDNLLNRCTPSEVIAVVAHEMGHYVMNHVVTLITWISLVMFVGFWFVDKAFHGLTGLFGGNWDVRAIDDPAGLPVVMALLSVFFLFATPVLNTISRTQEIQADIFGLNLARLPDAEATIDLKLGEYRKLDPSPLEEMIFYDHPSGRTRIWTAMRWKAEHIHDPDIMAGPVSPQ